jgi:hypothetical protein
MKLPWQKPRHTALEHLVGPSSERPEALRELSTHDLYKWVGGWREGTPQHITGMAEIRRRESKTAKWAIWIALGSLLVSIAALFTG